MKDFQVNDLVEIKLYFPETEEEVYPVVEAVILENSGMRLLAQITRQVIRPEIEFEVGRKFRVHPRDDVTLIGGLENE